MFDSGIGGITIYKEVRQLMPNENIIYLADSKNAPYGEKTKDQIIEFSIKNTEFLLERGCKLIIVACNTASTNAVKILRERYNVPFIRVQPAIKPAATNSKTKVVGILATKGTLTSELLLETSQKFAQGVTVVEQVGEGLVSLIEQGKINTDEMHQLLLKYTQPMLDQNIDQLVLGCTHYPFLRSQIEDIVGEKVVVLDSGEAIARQTKVILTEYDVLQDSLTTQPQHLFYSNTNPDVLQSFLTDIDSSLKAEQINF